MNPDLLLAHYHEIGLKGRNRPRFERALRDNLKRALGDSAGRVRLVSGRVEITEPKPDALERVTRVFGVANVAPVLVARADLAAHEVGSRLEDQDAAGESCKRQSCGQPH